MYLISQYGLDKLNTAKDKKIYEILESLGYRIIPNRGSVSEITLPQSFDYSVNSRAVGESLERIYEKSIDSEEVTKDSLKNYFGKTIKMESYLVYETKELNNYDPGKEFYLFSINDKFISYYIIDSEDSLTIKDEDIVRNNLIKQEKTKYYDFQSLNEDLKMLGFNIKETRSEVLESEYIDAYVKRLEVNINNEVIIVYEIPDNKTFKDALEMLKIGTLYDEKKHKVKGEDIKYENKVFNGETLIVLYEGKNNDLINILKEKLNYNATYEDKMDLTIKKDDVELHYYEEYSDREFKELILDEEVYEIKRFNKIVYQNTITVSLKEFYKEISEFTGDSIKLKIIDKKGKEELVEIKREDFYRSAFSDDSYVSVESVYGKIRTNENDRIQIGKKLTLEYFNLNKDNTVYNLKNGINNDKKVLVDNIKNIKVQLIEEKGHHIIFKSEFKLDVLDIFKNDWLKGDFSLSEDNKEMDKTLYFRVEKLSSNEYRIIDVYDEF